MGKGGLWRVTFVVWLLICDWPSAASGAVASATISTTSVSPTTSGSPTDGLGLAYAERCQAELFAYNNASLAYYSTAPPATETYANTLTETSISEAPTQVTSLTTLCDGHPRVVGHVSTGPGYTSVYTTAYTNTNVVRQTSFTQPPPCSIGPNDCASLWSSWSTHYEPLASAGKLTQGVLTPPCTTSTTTQSYTTNSAGKACDNCQIVASYARLLYWPVTTAPGSGDLCGKPATVLPGPTGTRPITFVTSNLTLTSPTAALSIALLSRADDCGPVITDTIIPVNPEEVQSVRGDRALAEHYPFNYADLNWHCADGEYASEGNHPDCYQEVPADAYFDGTLRWAGLDAMNVDWRKDKNLTIYNDYQPQILPPRTMTDAIARIWGPGCGIHPDGVWDPPKALQSADSEISVAWRPAKATPTPAAEGSSQVQSSRGPASRVGLSTYITATALAENTEAGPSWTGASAQSTPAPQIPSGGSGGSSQQSAGGQGQQSAGDQGQQSVGGQGQQSAGDQGQQSAGDQGQQSVGGQGQQSVGGQGQQSAGGQGQQGAGGQGQQSVASQGKGGSAAQTSGSAPKVVVIQSVTYTHVVQSGGLDVLTNSETCLTLAAATATGASDDIAGNIAAGIGMSREPSASRSVDTEPASRPPAVVVISEYTYTVVTASDNRYQLVGSATTIDVQAATSTQSEISTGSIISTSTPVLASTSSSATGSLRYSLRALSAAALMQILLYNLG